MNEIIEDAKKYISFNKDKSELEKILEDKNSDDDIKKMAELELNDLKLQFSNNEKIEIIFTS